MTDLYLTREYGKRGKMAKKRRPDVIFMQDEHIADCKVCHNSSPIADVDSLEYLRWI
jgi:hypothetical protein